MKQVVAALILVTLLATACAPTPSGPTSIGTQTPGVASPAASPTRRVATTLRFAIPNPTFTLAHTPWVVGVGQDFFAANGVKLDFQFTTGTPAVMQALASGGADMGFIDTAALATAVAAGVTNVKAVCSVVANNIYLVAVPESSDIQRPAQLKGKKIGIPNVGTGSHINAKALVREAGLDPDREVEFVPIEAPAAQLDALNKGTIAAVGTFDTSIGTFRAQGAKLRTFQSQGLNYQWSLIGASQAFTSANPDAVAGVCKGTLQGAAYTVACPEAALKAHRRQGYAAPSKDEDAVAVIKARADSGFRAPSEGGGKWGWVPVNQMNPLAQLYVQLGVVTRSVAVEQYYTNDFLDRIQFDVPALQNLARQDGGCKS